MSNTLSHPDYDEFSQWLSSWTQQQKDTRMSNSSTTVKVNKNTLRKFYKQWQRGERSKSEIERTEFGNLTARGQFITRLWQSRLGLSSTR